MCFRTQTCKAEEYWHSYALLEDVNGDDILLPLFSCSISSNAMDPFVKSERSTSSVGQQEETDHIPLSDVRGPSKPHFYTINPGPA
jgi:hypothetical protein